MSAHDGGPAFPVLELDQVTGNVCAQHMGMSLRDHVATEVLPTIYAEAVRTSAYITRGEDWRIYVAQDAYEMADAMLRARGHE